MVFRLQSLFGNRPAAPVPGQRSRLSLSTPPAVIYAIGDVHGCLDNLLNLHRQIVADAAGIEGDKLIVMLGDYVDRGPSSAGVLEFAQAAPPAGFDRVWLAGNHEAVMLEHFADPGEATRWLEFGGIETLASYEVDIPHYLAATGGERAAILKARVPGVHVDFVRALPGLLEMPGLIFVHAGIRPGIALDQQDDKDLLWIRGAFTDSTDDLGALVIHGHTPGRSPVVRTNRICVDTGAFATGVLTAVKLQPGQQPIFMTATANS